MPNKTAVTKEIVFLVEESPEGGYEAKVLGYSIYTAADTMEDMKKAVVDAINCHLESARRPKVIRLHMVKEEVIALEAPWKFITQSIN